MKEVREFTERLFTPKKRYRWIDAIGISYLTYREAEIVRMSLQRRWPKREFRVYGHNLSGFDVQVKCEVVNW